ncbi:MAG: transglycosylase SLT domain-containing protein [Anaerolineae bacterium]
MLRRLLVRLPFALLILAMLVALLPGALFSTFNAFSSALNRFSGYYGETRIAPLFTREVDYWADSIVRWADTYGVDPNLVATVMQIESCGHAGIASNAGAQGLFQVMPFHFDEGEVYTDPETNAARGVSYIRECLGWADGDPNLAMACYNGGPSMLNSTYIDWPDQTQRYYDWGSTIYADAQAGRSSSDSLQSWLDAGGDRLCAAADIELGLR